MTINYNFEWDPIKARKNRNKRGVEFEEAATVFKDSRRFPYLIWAIAKLKTDG